MGSNRSLRHRHNIRKLNSDMKHLYCKLTRSAERICMLCEEDTHALDETDSWLSLTEESITLPTGITMEAVNIMFDIHRRIGDIIDAYDGPLPPLLFDFFRDLIEKYRHIGR